MTSGDGPVAARVLAATERLFEVIPERRGVLPLPAAVLALYALAPGDLLALAPEAGTLHLEIYRELLADLDVTVSAAVRWECLRQFLGRPLAAVGPDGGLAIPGELFSLEVGEPVFLQVAARGRAHELALFRDEPAPRP